MDVSIKHGCKHLTWVLVLNVGVNIKHGCKH